MKARRVERLAERSWGDAPGKVERGDFEVTTDEKTGQRWFWFVCPGRCGHASAIALRPVVNPRPDQHSWEFDGNVDAPTLSPSINHVGCWHGWLRGGVFSPC